MIFINNKYTKWYYQIIENARSRESIEGYTEKHHIIPKSLGGSNDQINLVILTAREHFICHWLLTKMTKGKNRSKMSYACKLMLQIKNQSQTSRYKPKSIMYKLIQESLNTNLKNRKFSNEWREKLSDSAKIRCKNESEQIKIARAKKLIEYNKNQKGIPKPWQAGNKNTFAKKEIKQKIKDSNIKKYGYPNPSQIPYICEHCNKSGKGLAGYKRWHGENCKQNPINMK